MLTLAFNIQPAKAKPTTWTVDDDEPADFSTIQEAIDSPEVVDGDVIFVFSGTYYEHVTIDKSLSLIGEDSSTTIIDSSGTGTVIHVTASNVVISSFTIRNSGKEYWSMGIFLDGIGVTGCTIMSNNVSNNGGFGIFACWANDNSISNNLVTFNGRDGIRVDVSRNILTNNIVSCNGWLGTLEGGGIFLYGAFDCLIEGNTASNNRNSGIDVQGVSSNITIRDNIAENNGRDGIFHYGSLACSTEANTIPNNGANGISIYFSNDNIISHNTITSNNWHGIHLYRSGYNVIEENMVNSSGFDGIQLVQSNNNEVDDNEVTFNGWIGIWTFQCKGNIISGNTVVSNTLHGIMLAQSNSTTVTENKVADNDEIGILVGDYPLARPSNNTIARNIVLNNRNGICLEYSSNNTLVGNTVTNNSEWGIYINTSSNNTIYHNNFINTKQVYSYDSINTWDDGYPSGGNYCSDYKERYPNAMELDDSGIWDTPYEIDESNQDNYPLMEPWTPIDELKAEIEELGSEGEIDNRGIVKSLIAKLNVAQKLVDKGKIDEAISILEEDFIPQVHNLSGIHITPEAADILIESAEYILSHL